MDDPTTKCKLCILCQDGFANGIQWEYPKEGHYKGTRHFTKGLNWEPMKGHPLYNEHKKWCEILNLKDNLLALDSME